MNNQVESHMNILQRIFILPDDIIRVIKEYIPLNILQFTNKISYTTYHLIKRDIIYNYESYVREVVKRDHSFIFDQIIRENLQKWNHVKKYIYKNIIYASYIYFILDYCIENNSPKCRMVLSDYLKQHGLCQNQHKKNITKHIRWKN